MSRIRWNQRLRLHGDDPRDHGRGSRRCSPGHGRDDVRARVHGHDGAHARVHGHDGAHARDHGRRGHDRDDARAHAHGRDRGGDGAHSLPLLGERQPYHLR